MQVALKHHKGLVIVVGAEEKKRNTPAGELNSLTKRPHAKSQRATTQTYNTIQTRTFRSKGIC